MIEITTTVLENGRTRRVAVDSEAPDNPSTSPNDLFKSFPPKAVAYWEFVDVDGVREGKWFMVRPDLQGQGYSKRLAPYMAKLAADTPVEFRNVINPKMVGVRDEMELNGSLVDIVGYKNPE